MLAWLIGCAGPGLSPDLDVRGDTMLAALPSDVTLVVGGDLRSVRGAPLLAEVLAHLGVDRADLDARVEEAGGLSAGTEAVDALRVGCGDAGCAALLEGDFTGARTPTLPEPGARAGGLRVRAAPTRLAGLDAQSEAGERYALRLLSDTKGILGDRAAVRAVRRARGQGLDVSRLEGDIPEGDLWIAAWDLDRLTEQAARRAERAAPGAGEDLRDWVARLAERAPVPLSDLATVALSVRLDAGAEARIRVRCTDEAAALTVAMALDVAAARVRDRFDVTVVRDGLRVEAAGAVDAETLLTLVEGG